MEHDERQLSFPFDAKPEETDVGHGDGEEVREPPRQHKCYNIDTGRWTPPRKAA